ncbi:MAG: PLP-dependent aminotransferase family protein, partial [Bdellovibrionota bacterium]
MKTFLLQIQQGQTPAYLRVAHAFRVAIRAGQLVPGEVLPSTRELAQHLGLNRHTVMNAVHELIAEGWILTEEKKRYRIKTTLHTAYSTPGNSRAFPVSSHSPNRSSIPNARFARQASVDRLRQEKKKWRHSFPSGFPDPRLFPIPELKSELHTALRSRDVLRYEDPGGNPFFVEQVTTYLRRIRNVTGREIVVTHGSQEALFLLAQVLIKPGDWVGVEALGYPPAHAVFRYAGARLEPISIDREGLSVEHLVSVLKRKRIRFLYLTPLHQYPTTVTLSQERRLRLYQIARKHDIAILEDDYDHEFHYISQPSAPLASQDPDGRVLYVSTLSKILFPSARVGFMAVLPRIAEEIRNLKRISSRQNETLLEL